MGNDAGYRDTLPTRSKRGHRKRLEEKRVQQHHCEDHDRVLVETLHADLGHDEPKRWLEL